MEKLHTIEPWEAYVAVFGGQECLSVAHKGIPEYERQRAVAVLSPADSMDEEDIANARRIVACVNACRSVSDEDLADDCVEKMKADRNALLIQRDELLSALRALYGWQRAEVEHFGATTPDDFIIEMVEKAIKNA